MEAQDCQNKQTKKVMRQNNIKIEAFIHLLKVLLYLI